MKPIITTLPNGVRIVMVEQSNALTATALVLVGAGSATEEKATSGISHVLEHMSFKGTPTLPNTKAIAETFERLGAISNAFTSTEYTGYYAKGSPAHLDTFLEVLSDMYQNSTFPESELSKEKGVIIEEINMYEDMPQYKVTECLLKLMYADQPAGWSIVGTKQTVSSFTRADLVTYKDKHYHARNTVIAITGAIDPKKVRAKVAALFKTLPDKKLSKPKKTVIKKATVPVVITHKPIDQAHIAIGFHGMSQDHPNRFVASLIATILGRGLSARLTHVLREELGAAYYTHASIDTYKDRGVFEITAGVDTKRINEILARIAQILKEIKTDLVSVDELQKAVEYTIGMQRLGLESSDEIAGFFGVQVLLRDKPNTPTILEKHYRAVTPADIRRVARTLFISDKAAISVLGPYKDRDIDPGPFRTL